MTLRARVMRILGGAATLAVVASMGSAVPAGAEEEAPDASTTGASCTVTGYADKSDYSPYKVWGTGYTKGCEPGTLVIDLFKADGNGLPVHVAKNEVKCTSADCSGSTPTLTYPGGNYCVRVEFGYKGYVWDCLM